MENLYSVAEFLENCEIEKIVIDDIIEKFNSAFVDKDETFSAREFSYIRKNDFLLKNSGVYVNGKNTSFNAIDNSRKIGIVFPLYENLLENRELIKQEDRLENFYGLIKHLQKTYNVKVNEQAKLNSLFKTSATLAKKPKIEVDFSQGITLPNGKIRMLSSSEKLIKVLDAVAQAYTYTLFSKNKDYYPTKVKYCTQLVVDYLLLTKLKFTDEMVKHKLCKALGLQLCNKLNACDISDLENILTFSRKISNKMASMLSENEVIANKDLLLALLNNESKKLEMPEQTLNLQPKFFKEEVVTSDVKEEDDIYFNDNTDDLKEIDFIDCKLLTYNEKSMLESENANEDVVVTYFPAIIKNNEFKKKTYLNAFDKMLNRILKKKAMSFENKIIKTENEKQISKNRRVRQFLAFFYLKYNLLIQGDENNINVDKYYFDDLTLSDESKAFELAKIIYNLRNNAITFIEANNDFMLNKTPKQKMNYVAGLYGKEKLDSYVKFLLNSAVKELVSNKKTTQNNTQEDELNF